MTLDEKTDLFTQKMEYTVMAKLEWTPYFFTIYYQEILLYSIVYNNEVDKSMDKKISQIISTQIVFNLIQLFYTKAKISGSQGKET